MVISKKVEGYLSRASWVRKMFEEGEELKRTQGPDKVFDFSLGNPVDEPPLAFHQELLKLALNPVYGMHRYMSNAGYTETRQAIAVMLALETGLPFTENHIVMTCGAGGALNVALKTILDPGDEVIILAPFFVEYIFYIENHGGIPATVPTSEEFLPDLMAIEAAINEKTRAIIINSPNNPTGVVYPASCLEQLGELLKTKEAKYKKNIYVISDEPYAKIVYDGVSVPSVFKSIKNSILCTSYSKDLALPGERIGYLAINPRIERADLLMGGLIFCNRTLGFVNAPALMQRLVTNLQREMINVSEYQEKRDLIYNNLTEMGFQMVKPQGAFYFFPRSPLPDDIAFVRAAQKYNILLVPGSGFGLSGYFRLAYCVEKKVIIDSLPAFAALAKEIGLVPTK